MKAVRYEFYLRLILIFSKFKTKLTDNMFNKRWKPNLKKNNTCINAIDDNIKKWFRRKTIGNRRKHSKTRLTKTINIMNQIKKKVIII